jgi:hypothetical protein
LILLLLQSGSARLEGNSRLHGGFQKGSLQVTREINMPTVSCAIEILVLPMEVSMM